MLNLPEDAARWEAPTAYAWMALSPRGSRGDELLNFRTAVRSTFDLTLSETVHLTEEQHIYIVVITLARFLWSIKELQASPLMDVVPERWPLLEHKVALLDKLDSYVTSPHSIKARGNDSGFQQSVQTALVVHLSHLYGSSDLMDWLPVLLRSSGLNRVARERMKAWGEEDGARMRKVVYHSAGIIKISRDFPFNGPYEAFYVFYAGAALWCAATVLREGNDHTNSGTNVNEEPPIFLDKHVDERDHVRDSKVLQWIRDGGTVKVGLYGVPVLGSDSSPMQVLDETLRILDKMRVWAISKAFAEVLRQLSRAESARGRS